VKKELAAGFLPPDLLVLPEDVREEIQRKLSEIAVLGCQVAVEGPSLVAVTIKVTVEARSPSTHSSRIKLAELIVKRLNQYLNPYVGGPDESGWPFGRSISADELRGIIQTIPGVERVQSLTGADPVIQFDQVLRSGMHLVEVLERGSGS
jgi:hypothetical protein